MIRLRERRFWTALVLMGLSLMTMNMALPMLRFAVADLFVTPRNAQRMLEPYVDSPITAKMARTELMELVPPTDFETRTDDLQALLNATPLSSQAWLGLAEARLESGGTPQEVASALALSGLSGPNEGGVMAGRARFGLPLWDELPPDFRRTLEGDLVGSWGEFFNERQRNDLATSLKLGSGVARQQIRAFLLLNGKAGTQIADRLGLVDETPVPGPNDGAGAVLGGAGQVTVPAQSTGAGGLGTGLGGGLGGVPFNPGSLGTFQRR